MRRFWLVILALALGGCSPAPNLPPIPFIRVEPQQGEVPLFVRADATSSYDPEGTPIHAIWDFGNGAQAEGLTATHRYDQEGAYSLTLTVVDGTGLATMVKVSIEAGVSYPLDVLEWHVEEIYYGQRVYGRVKNIGQVRIHAGRVAVRFYDANWNLIRERSKTLSDLPPGAEQMFEITTDLRLSEVGGAPNHTIHTEVIHADFPLSG